MNQDIEVTLTVRSTTGAAFNGGAAILRWIPRQGDYLEHDLGEGTSHLYRVIAVVFPTNPNSAQETFDVHVVDEGPSNGALEKALSQQSAALSKTERLIIRNQHEILSHVDKREHAWHKEAQEVFERGYECFYQDYFGDTQEVPADAEVCRLVFDVLQMYDALHRYLSTNGEDSLRKSPYAQFPGFDGNDEAVYLDFATFVMGPKKRFTYLLKNPNQGCVNSHHATLSAYRRMLHVWKNLPNNLWLDAESALAVLDAATKA